MLPINVQTSRSVPRNSRSCFSEAEVCTLIAGAGAPCGSGRHAVRAPCVPESRVASRPIWPRPPVASGPMLPINVQTSRSVPRNSRSAFFGSGSLCINCRRGWFCAPSSIRLARFHIHVPCPHPKWRPRFRLMRKLRLPLPKTPGRVFRKLKFVH